MMMDREALAAKLAAAYPDGSIVGARLDADTFTSILAALQLSYGQPNYAELARQANEFAPDPDFQAACQRYAHGNGSSAAIAAAAMLAAARRTKLVERPLITCLKRWLEWHRKAADPTDDSCDYLNGDGWDDAEELATHSSNILFSLVFGTTTPAIDPERERAADVITDKLLGNGT